jgi:DNA-directed RNA polymerases I, II, and III subunit RPABC1
MNRKFTPPPTKNDPNPVPQTGTIFVQFCAEQGSIGVSVVKNFVMSCVTAKHKTGIFITSTALSPQARKAISAASTHASIEAFLEEDLLVNITHHELVPTHILLSKEEKNALLRRYRLKETQLPRILQRDPIARYMGLKRGQVVKIIRDSETAGRYASYRLCV